MRRMVATEGEKALRRKVLPVACCLMGWIVKSNMQYSTSFTQKLQQGGTLHG